MNGAASPTSPPLEAGTRALVLGLGRTGLSCARYLRRKGLAVRVADTRAEPPGAAALREQVPEVELRTGAFDDALLEGVAQVVISPGLSLREPVAVEAVRRGLPVVGDIELFAREAQAPVAAITGTNGKSTVTALLAEVATAAGRPAIAGGNLGDPALDLLERPVPALYVLELSSFQLETTHSLRTADGHGAERHAGPPRPLRLARGLRRREGAHLRRLRDRGGERGRRARARHAAHRTARAQLQPARRRRPTTACWRGREPLLACRGEPLLPLASLRLQGGHNAANALAALAMGEALGLPRAPVLEALARSAGCRTARSGWRTWPACATSTTRRAPTSARPSPRSRVRRDRWC